MLVYYKISDVRIRIATILFFCCLASLTFGQITKIMTYNIRLDYPKKGENSWQQRKVFLTGQLSFYEPDIFGIQEGLPHQVRYIDSILPNYNFVGVGRDDGMVKGEYSAIFYNTDKFEVIQQATFWLSETPDMVSIGWDAAMERICTYALFKDKKSKHYFWVFNTHFDHIGDKARVNSAKLIVDRINSNNPKNYPVILMGDFNLEPQSNGIEFILNYFNDSKMVSLKAPFGPKGTFNGFNFEKPVTRRIDYIFVSKKNCIVHKYAVLSDAIQCRYPSDHLPVYIELSLLIE